MLHTHHVMESLWRGEWFATIDLQDVYFHVPICLEHWRFLRFAFQGQAYKFKVFPFCLSLSPRVFTRVVKFEEPPVSGRLTNMCSISQAGFTGYQEGPVQHPVRRLQGELEEMYSRKSLVSMDASRTGWGAVWEGIMVRGSWEPP